MSLINDALQRAKLAQKRNPTPAAESLPLRPVDPPRPRPARRLFWMPLALGVALLAGALLATVTLRSPSRPGVIEAAAAPAPERTRADSLSPATPPAVGITPASPQVIPAAAPVSSVLASAAPLPSIAGASVPSAAPPAAQNIPGLPEAGVTAASPVETARAAEAALSPAQPALPKLQGIFYREQRPAALVNGKMVLIGSMVGEHRVTAISPHTVTLVSGGVTNVLRLD